jgi:hypothetical protein
VLLARALMRRPRLLILDEPTASMSGCGPMSSRTSAVCTSVGVTLLALAGPPPEGLIERHDLPAAPPISLTVRSRPVPTLRSPGPRSASCTVP